MSALDASKSLSQPHVASLALVDLQHLQASDTYWLRQELLLVGIYQDNNYD